MLEQILSESDSPWCDTAALRQSLPETEIFLIDNVSEYLYAQTDQEVWDVEKDFPCLAPPFPSFWMEHSRPSKIVSCEHGTQSANDMPHRIGLWFNYTKITPEAFVKQDYLQASLKGLQQVLNKEFTPEIEQEWKSIIAQGADFVDIHDRRWDQLSRKAMMARSHMLQYCTYTNFAKQGFEPLLKLFTEKNAVWIGKCAPYIQHRRNGPVVGPLGEHNMLLNHNGDVIETSASINLKLIRDSGDWCRDGGGLSTLWFPGLLAISFCHCRNVTVRTEEKPAQLLKKQADRGRRHVTYKLLEITPMKTVLKKAGAENPQTGLRRALHICRGHFASYEEKGLFGKYRGRFWIPQHIRGTPESGVVAKDYAVNRPQK